MSESKYLTVVFNVSNLDGGEVDALINMPSASVLRWGHAVDELHSLERKNAEYERTGPVNANLIAAAPDLLLACMDLVRLCCCYKYDIDATQSVGANATPLTEALGNALSAIEKATGGTE